MNTPLDLIREALATVPGERLWAYARGLQAHAPAERLGLFRKITALLDRHPQPLPPAAGKAAADLLFGDRLDEDAVRTHLLYPWLENVAERLPARADGAAAGWPPELVLGDEQFGELARRGRLPGAVLCRLAQTAGDPRGPLSQALARLAAAGDRPAQELVPALALLAAGGHGPAAALFDVWACAQGRKPLADQVRALLAPGALPAAGTFKAPALPPGPAPGPPPPDFGAETAPLPAPGSWWGRCREWARAVKYAAGWRRDVLGSGVWRWARAVGDVWRGCRPLPGECRGWLRAVWGEEALGPVWRAFGPPVPPPRGEARAGQDPRAARDAAVLLLLARLPGRDRPWAPALLPRLARAVERAWPGCGCLPPKTIGRLSAAVGCGPDTSERVAVCLEALRAARPGRRLGLRHRLTALLHSAAGDPEFAAALRLALAACPEEASPPPPRPGVPAVSPDPQPGGSAVPP